MIAGEPYEIFNQKPYTCYKGVDDVNLYLINTKDEWNAFYEVLMKRPRVACDTETSGFEWFRQDRIIGMSFGWGAHNFYIPVRHEASELGGEPPPQLDMDWLRPQLQAFFNRKDVITIWSNGRFDKKFYKADGIDINTPWHDTLFMWKQIDENAPAALKTVSSGWRDSMGIWHYGLVNRGANADEKLISEWRGLEAKARRQVLKNLVNERALELQSEIKFQGYKKPALKAWIADNELQYHKYRDADKESVHYGFIPVIDMTKYAALDTYLTYKVYEHCLPIIQSNPKVTEIYKNEIQLSDALFVTETRGVYVNIPYMTKVEKETEIEVESQRKALLEKLGKIPVLLKAATKKREEIWGEDYPGLGSADQLSAALINNCGIKLTEQTDSGKWKLDKKVLVKLAKEHPICKEIIEFRKLEKLLTTYIRNVIRSAVNGILYSNTNQSGTKCMPAGELVLTSRGYIPVETVKVGDKVITHTGKTQKVIETSTHAPKPIYRVTLNSGLSLRTTGNHEYYCSGIWVRADELTVGDAVTTHSACEEWKSIPEWEQYEVSSWGRVRNIQTQLLLSPQPKGKWGHLKVCLSRNKATKRGPDRKDFPIHKLVALTFLGKSGGLEVRHLNGISWDNTVANLTYGTVLENRHDAVLHGTMLKRNNGSSKLTTEIVQEIRSTKIRSADRSSSRSKISREDAETIKNSFTGKRGELVELGKKYNVTSAAIHRIVTGLNWNKPAPSSEGLTVKEIAAKYGVTRESIRDILSGKRWPEVAYVTGSEAKFSTSTVHSIVIEPRQLTHGLTVENDHSHVTGGIVTHNTGRSSSSGGGAGGINLQNLPGKDKIIRRAFMAPPGDEYIAFYMDYSQVEVRLTAHFSGDPVLQEAYRTKQDVHLRTACGMFGLDYEEARRDYSNEDHPRYKELDELRKVGKVLNFAAVYQVSPMGLSEQIPRPTRYAHLSQEGWANVCGDFLDKYFEAHRYVKKFIIRSNRFVRTNGFFETTFGRVRHLPEYKATKVMMDDTKYWMEQGAQRQGTNFGIQGEAADIFKFSVVKVYKLLKNTKSYIFNLVHDDVQMYIHKDDLHLVPRIKAILEDWKYDVPLVVDVCWSKTNWAEKRNIDGSNLEAILALAA